MRYCSQILRSYHGEAIKANRLDALELQTVYWNGLGLRSTMKGACIRLKNPSILYGLKGQ